MVQNHLSRYFALHYIVRYAIAFLLFACTVEFCARIDDKIKYQVPLFARYSSEVLQETDSDGIRRNVPNSRFEKWQINEQGFRGESVPAKKGRGLIRIVCMGTSESFGLYEDPKMEWPAQLGVMLRDYKRYEVINASVVGLGLGNFVPYLRKYVIHIEPDIVILYVNPYFYCISKLRETNRRENNPSSKEVARKVLKEAKIKISDRLRPRSLSKIKQAVKQQMPQPLLKTLQIWNLSRQVREQEELYSVEKNPLDVVPNEYLESFEMDMIYLVDFLKRYQVKVILSTYPSLITQENLRQHIEIFLDFRRFSIGLSFQGMLDAHKRFNHILRLVAEKTGVGFVDNSRIVPKDIQYFGDNVHYTNKGAELVALSFADFILFNSSMASGF